MSVYISIGDRSFGMEVARCVKDAVKPIGMLVSTSEQLPRVQENYITDRFMNSQSNEELLDKTFN